MEIEGIVIRTTPYRDQDVMVTIITKDGFVPFCARGTLKMESKNASSIIKFTKSKFNLYHGKEGFWLRNAQIVDSYSKCKANFDCLAVLELISELTVSLIASEDAKNIYSYLDKSLDLLERGFSPKTIAILYIAKALNASGYSMEIDACQKCGSKTSIVGLNIRSGGFVCDKCFNGLNDIKLSAHLLKMVRYIFKVDIDNFDKVEFDDEECEAIIPLLFEFIENVVDINLKSKKLFQKL